jgi:hypothetical protein
MMHFEQPPAQKRMYYFGGINILPWQPEWTQESHGKISVRKTMT